MSGEGAQSLLELSRVGFQGSGGLWTPPNRSPLRWESAVCALLGHLLSTSQRGNLGRTLEPAGEILRHGGLGPIR